MILNKIKRKNGKINVNVKMKKAKKKLRN